MSEYSMRQYAEDFIVYKKALGYVYDGPERTLYRYVEFVESTSPSLVIPAKTVTDDYLASVSDSAATLYHTCYSALYIRSYLQKLVTIKKASSARILTHTASDSLQVEAFVLS